jgi:hypothetical protein
MHPRKKKTKERKKKEKERERGTTRLSMNCRATSNMNSHIRLV